MNNKTVVHFHFTFNHANTPTAVKKQIKAVVSWKKTFLPTECLLLLTMHSTKYSVNIILSTLSTVAHQILVNLLLKVGVGHNVAIWVLSYLSDHTSDRETSSLIQLF